jgi:hypothetical protein
METQMTRLAVLCLAVSQLEGKTLERIILTETNLPASL